MAQPNVFSIETPEPQAEPSVSGKPRRSIYAKGSELTSLLGAKTIFEAFRLSTQLRPDKNCLGKRMMSSDPNNPYLWDSYSRVYDRILCLGSGLQTYGVIEGSMVGICCKTCPEWVIAGLACCAYGFVEVPMFDNLRPSTFDHIINETEMTLLITTCDKLELLLMDRPKYPALKTIILIDDVKEGDRDRARKVDINICHFTEVEAAGKREIKDTAPDNPESVVANVYKAGTSETSRGVLLTNANLMAAMGGLETLGNNDAFIKVTQDDVYFSYLPLAQLTERLMISLILFQGGEIGFFHGDFSQFFEDVMALRPTVLSSVPGILSSLREELMAESEESGHLSNAFFNFAVKGKRKNLRHGKLDHYLYDKIAFKKVHQAFGGRVRALLYGSTPSTPEVVDFFRVALGCEMYEMYGLAETSGIATITAKGDYDTGHVGAPLPGTEIKLVADEFGHSPSEQPFPRGEICFRGPTTFKGYFKDTGKNIGRMDQDGWFHSGDIGMFDTKGRLRILAGKGQIIKLPSGELVFPEKTEAVYCKSKWVAWCFIDLDHTGDALLAVIIPEEHAVTVWAKDHKIQGEMKELIKNPKLKHTIMKDLAKIAVKSNLGSHERARDIFVDDTVVSVENEILTPFFRTIRRNASRYFHAQLMEISEAPPPAEPVSGPSFPRRLSHPFSRSSAPQQQPPPAKAEIQRQEAGPAKQEVTTTTTIDTTTTSTTVEATMSPNQPSSAMSPQPRAPPVTPATPADNKVAEEAKVEHETQLQAQLQAKIEAHLSGEDDLSKVDQPEIRSALSKPIASANTTTTTGRDTPQAKSSLSPVSG